MLQKGSHTAHNSAVVETSTVVPGCKTTDMVIVHVVENQGGLEQEGGYPLLRLLKIALRGRGGRQRLCGGCLMQ
jgi:hypothetical protein